METLVKYLVTGRSYHQCRNCGQFHDSTARDCGMGYVVTEIPLVARVYRVLNGKLYQVLDTTPPIAPNQEGMR